jgi:hypothetical protein
MIAVFSYNRPNFPWQNYCKNLKTSKIKLVIVKSQEKDYEHIPLEKIIMPKAGLPFERYELFRKFQNNEWPKETSIWMLDDDLKFKNSIDGEMVLAEKTIASIDKTFPDSKYKVLRMRAPNFTRNRYQCGKREGKIAFLAGAFRLSKDVPNFFPQDYSKGFEDQVFSAECWLHGIPIYCFFESYYETKLTNDKNSVINNGSNYKKYADNLKKYYGNLLGEEKEDGNIYLDIYKCKEACRASLKEKITFGKLM